MKRHDMLPILRRWKAWCALAAAMLILLVSVCWTDKASADSEAGINEIYRQMDVRFVLHGGRRSLTSGFSISITDLREIMSWDYFESFGGSDLVQTFSASDSRKQNNALLQVRWTPDPDAAGFSVLEGELGEGIWLCEQAASELSVGAGKDILFQARSMGYGSGEGVPFTAKVTAVISGTENYMPIETFEKAVKWYQAYGNPTFYMNDLHFSLKKKYNFKMSTIEQKLQSLLNTPHPANRNRDVSINYNASEIEGMLRPLERSLNSSQFFGKLFRIVLPLVAYVLEIIAVLGLRNEIGVRRFLGDGGRAVDVDVRVLRHYEDTGEDREGSIRFIPAVLRLWRKLKFFAGIWLPVFGLCLPGYLLCLLLLLTPLGEHIPWQMAGLHLAGTAVLTSAIIAVLCAADPARLLRERDNEQA